MNILVHSKTMQVTDSIREFITKQCQKVGKLSNKIKGVNVFMETVKTSRGMEQEAQVKVQVVLPGKAVMSTSKAHDLYLAVSEAMKDASQTLRRKKEKWSYKGEHRASRRLPLGQFST